MESMKNSTDVVVIAGGILGVTLSYFLMEEGISNIVLNKGS